MPVAVVAAGSWVLWWHTRCDPAVTAQDSCAVTAFTYPCPGLPKSSHLASLYTLRACPAALALSGSAAWCCLGLSCSLPQVQVFHFLNGR